MYNMSNYSRILLVLPYGKLEHRRIDDVNNVFVCVFLILWNR